MEQNRRSTDDNRLWEVIGNHDGRLTTLEAAKYQGEQAIMNHRQETSSHIEKLEAKVEQMFNKITTEIFTPLLQRVGRIERFMYFAIGGGSVLGILLTIIVNWDNIKSFFGGHP